MSPANARLLGLLALALALSPGVATAQMYAVTSGPPAQLLTINTATGAGTLVGNTTLGIFPFGLAFRGAKLYTWDQGPNRITELDPATGATLSTINIGLALVGEGDLAFRSDGIGFIVTAGATPALYRFDITVPNSTPINLAMAQSFDGLAFNGAGVLYGLRQSTGGAEPTIPELYTIDQVTGVTTLVGSTGIVGPFGTGGLAFDASGNLFAAVSNGGASTFFSINPATGTGTVIGNVGFNGVCGLRGPGVPPPPGPAGPGGNGEGTYAGSKGPGGSEGSFGFGGGMAALRLPSASRPVLSTPFYDNFGRQKVLNVSQRLQQATLADGQIAQAEPTSDSDLNGVLIPALILTSLLLLALFGFVKYVRVVGT
jgi:hypothetical protein